MKLIALTLQYQSTKAIRLFAIIAILFLANTANGQVADSLRKAKPDRRWGIGIGFGGFYNIIPSAIQFDSQDNTPTTSRNNKSFSLDLSVEYRIKNIKLSTVFNYNRYNVHNFSDTSGINNGNPDPQIISNEYTFNYNLYHFSQRVSALNLKIKNIAQVELGFSANLFLLSNLLLDATSIIKENNTVNTFKGQTITPGGIGFGGGFFVSTKFKIINNVHIGFDLTSLYVYSKAGGLIKAFSKFNPNIIEYSKFTIFKDRQFLPIRPAITLSINL